MRRLLSGSLTIACVRTAALAVMVAAAACGTKSPTSPSSSSSTSSLPVSESAIQTIVTNFARGASNAANTGSSGYSSTSALTVGFVPPSQGAMINQPFSQRTNCQTGGYHETSGRISGTVDTTGNGISRLQMNATTTIQDYACMGGGWIVNGDPYISGTGEVRVTGASAAFDFGQSLGWKATNASSGKSFSCQHSVKVTWDTATAGRVQGYVTCSSPTTTINISATF